MPRSSKPKYEAGTTVAVPVSELRNYGRNPRKGNVDVIAASLTQHGQYRPITANIGTYTGRPNEVLAGNHTLKAARQLKWDLIKVEWVDVDENQAAAIVAADNRTSELGGYNGKALANLLGQVSGKPADVLDGIGYSQADIDKLLTPPPTIVIDPTPDPDPDPDPEPGPPGGPGRGEGIISFAIVFDDAKQKKAWMEFMAKLRRDYPDYTAVERLMVHIDEAMAAG